MPLFAAKALLAQESGPSNNPSIDLLAKSLSDPRFESREKAAAQLIGIGPVAIPSLDRVKADGSRDARLRAERIISEIEKQHLKQRSKAFLLDSIGTNSHGLPAWNAFREIAGEGRTSKLLFLETLKANYQLAQQIEELYQVQLDGHSAVEISEAQQMLSEIIKEQSGLLMPRIFHGTGVTVGDSTALLLAVSMLEESSPAPMEVNQFIHSCIQLSFFGYLNRPGYRQCFQRLLTQWLPRTQDTLAPEVMRIAFDLDLPVVLPIARRHLSQGFDKTTREYAIFCVGKFGDITDVSELLKLMHDTTVVHEFDDTAGGIVVSRIPPPGIPGDAIVRVPHKLVRVNDMAAVAAMILLDEDPRSLFPQFAREHFYNRSLSPLAIEQEQAEIRNEQIKAWAAQQVAKSNA